MDQRQQFSSFFAVFCDSDFHFRLLGDEIIKAHLTMEQIEDQAIFDRLLSRSDSGLTPYFVVNAGGQKTEDITKVRAYFIDNDGTMPLDEFVRASAELPPHLIVRTSKDRYHAYWLVSDGNLDSFPAIQRALASKFSSDPTVCDLPRIMRIPGFKNHKNGFLCHIHTYTPNDTITTQRLISTYHLLNGHSSAHTDSAPPARGFFEPGKKVSQGERNTRLFNYAVSLFGRALATSEVITILLQANKDHCLPPVPKEEVHNIINSASRTKAHIQAIKDFKDTTAEDLQVIQSLPTQPQDTDIDDTTDDNIPEATVSDIAQAIAPHDAATLSLPPGQSLVERVYSYLMDSCFETTHELALAGAMAFVGALKGHSCRTYSNARTNLFILALAPSGTGKTEIKNKLYQLTAAAEIKNFNISNPSSEPGLLDALSISRRRFLCWDEVGLRLKAITRNRNANSYESGIVSFILEVFSSASSIFLDKTRKSEKRKGANQAATATEAEIPYPHLGIFAISTPQTFYSAISLDQVDDGFIPRFLPIISSAQTPRLITQQRIETTDIRKYQPLIDEIAEIWRSNSTPTDFDDIVPGSTPRTILFDEDAFSLWTSYQYSCKLRLQGRFAPIWARAAEHAMKLALTVTDGGSISLASTAWAIKTVDDCIESFLSVSHQDISDTPEHKAYHQILAFVAKSGQAGTTKAEMYARFARVKGWKDLLNDAIQAGAIQIVSVTGRSGRKRDLLRASPQALSLATEANGARQRFALPQLPEIPQPQGTKKPLAQEAPELAVEDDWF